MDGELPASTEGVFAEMLKTIQEAPEPVHSGHRVRLSMLGQPDRQACVLGLFILAGITGACTPAFRSSIRRRRRTMDATLDISVVVPLYNEEESLPELVEWIDRVARGEGLSYEVILVDDGSGDGSWRVIESLHERFAAVRGIKFARNYGKSAALYCGFAEARGEVVFTMDADLQDSPDEIPALRHMVLDEGYDLVSGWKKKRHDPAGKRWPSKFFNWTARIVSGIRLHDFNCGLKAYRRRVVKAIEVYGEMHRLYSDSGKTGRIRADRREGRRASRPQVRSVRNSAWSAW